jgi:hypothetical protein
MSKQYSTQELIDKMEYCKNTHAEWGVEQRARMRAGIPAGHNVDCAEVQAEWVNVYSQVIEKLKCSTNN